MITYQINYSVSSTLDDSNWQFVNNSLSASIVPVFPNAYKIGVRAVDDSGNFSASTVADWSFPGDFVPLPSQLDRSSIVGTAGGAQKILITATTTISAIAFYSGPDSGSFCCSQAFVRIYRDNGDSLGQLVASSTENTLNQYDSARELIYSFSPSIQLETNTYYWFGLYQGPSETTNGMRIYGSLSDPYPDGYYSSGVAGADAYFRLISQ